MAKKIIRRNQYAVYPSILGNCTRLTGYPTDGNLLYRIYLRSKSSTKEDPKGEDQWAILSQKQWVHDTGLTTQQYRDSLARLKKKKLVRYKNEYTGKIRYGNPPLWIKPTESTIKNITKKGPKITMSGDTLDETTMSTDTLDSNTSRSTDTLVDKTTMSTDTLLDSSEESTREESKQVYARERAVPSSGTSQRKKFLNKSSGENKMGTMKDFKNKNRKGIEVIENKNKSSFDSVKKKYDERDPPRDFKNIKQFEIMWITNCKEYNPEVDFVPLTSKEKNGTVKSIIDRCRIVHIKPAELILFLIENWQEFCDIVEAEKGLKKKPSVPQLGYVFYNLQEACMFFKDNHEPNSRKSKRGSLSDKEMLALKRKKNMERKKREKEADND